jgi:predicted XRE-type DNA-binding protein
MAKKKDAENVLADLGFADAEELTAKAQLARKINDVLQDRRLTQQEAAHLLGIPQPKVSAIRNYHLRGISLERLMQALTALDHHIEIVVTKATRRPSPGST